MMSERQVRKRAVDVFVDAHLVDDASINSFIDRRGLFASKLRFGPHSGGRSC